MKNKVYLVSVDDSANNWQVIVFANDTLEAINIAKEAYRDEYDERCRPDTDFGVTKVEPPYFWIG